MPAKPRRAAGRRQRDHAGRRRGWSRTCAVAGALAAVLAGALLDGRPATTRALLALVVPAPADADFSFSDEEQRDHKEQQREHEGRARDAAAALSAACRAEIAKHRTAIVIAEQIDSGGFRTQQSKYGLHFQELSRALRRLGVRTYTQEEIRAQVAQAEIDAYFRNDPDAALAASRKLGADLVLRGVISSRSAFNDFMGLPEVAVTIGLALADGSGRVVSESSAHADSYSSHDTLGMALRLVSEQAPSVLLTLYRDYCARTTSPTRTR